MKLFLLNFLTTLLLTTSKRIRCESFCKFRFCANLLRDGPQLQPENRALLLGIPNAALGPVPCIVKSSGKKTFMSNVTGGEATVSREFSLDPFVPISHFSRRIANPDFPRNFFKWLDNDSTNGRQSIARRFPRGNQEDLIDEVCVRMPVKSFDILRGDGSVKRRFVARGRRSCIGFRTIVPTLLVDFEWSSTNDFDLRLQEPNGFEINRFGQSFTSPNNGTLIFDVGGKICQPEFGRENIVYRRNRSLVEPGKYTIRVDHLRKCSNKSKYKLRVYYNGLVLLNKVGTISEVGESIIVSTFDIPE